MRAKTDGKLRCPSCRGKRRRELTRLKHGKSPYEIWVKDSDRAKQTRRALELRKRYGLTVEEYQTLLARQEEVCAICRTATDGKVLAVDHDHLTGQVRGLLCDRCNLLLGRVEDDPSLLRRAAEYLEAA